MTNTRSTCPYCGVGCGVIIESDGEQITHVRGDPDHPANFGRLCTKGSTLHLTASAEITRQTRLLHPMKRFARGQPPQAIGWDQALDDAADTFSRIVRDHGPDSIGLYVSGQLLTEDYYVFNKLAKGLIGTNNIDTNSRLCMSSAVAGYKQTLGADAPPACYDDLKHAQCLFIVGSNAAWAHPILFRRIEDAKAANSALKIIVVDPRRTDTAEIADLFLPIQPGSDVMLFNGMLHLMLWEGWTDSRYIGAHTRGFDELKASVRECTPDKVARICGIAQDDLLAAARLFATSSATLSLYCQGLNQSTSGTAKNAALINLHLATAQIGKPGAGPFSLTGQPNAMGGREVGGLANLLSAHRDLSNPTHRAEVAALWGVPSVPEKPGRTAIEMFEAAADGEIRALWIACTNPAQSLPAQATVRRALERAEFVVVQEAFATTATCDYADLLLPASTWGEKEGTVTNSERRISRVSAAVPPPGEARADWRIATEFARRLELRLGDAAEGRRGLFLWDSAEAVWNEHRESTRGRDLDITGLSYAMLAEQGPQQWPLPSGAGKGKSRLYEDGIFPTADGRARFVVTPFVPVAEAREARFPLSLNTGRLRDQWHGMSRTGTLGRLFGHIAEPAVQMHAQDMQRRQLQDGDLVRLESRHGSLVLPAQASAELGLNQAFVAMHWGEEFLGGVSGSGERMLGVNALTTPAFCPSSKQPELKHVPVRIEKAGLPWRMLAMAWLPAAEFLRVQGLLKKQMQQFGFATCVPFADNAPLAGPDDRQRHEQSGLLFRAAATEAPADAVMQRIEGLLGLEPGAALHYVDRKHGQRRAARLQKDGELALLDAFLLAGDTSAEAWIATLLRERLPAQSYGRLLLLRGSRAPIAIAPRGRPVCSCFSVTDLQIDAFLAGAPGAPETRLASLQGALKCGTNCGSCIPELKRRVRDAVEPVAAS